MRYIHFTIIVFTISAALSACNNNNKTTDTSYSKKEDDSLNRTFNIDTAAILKDFSSWYNYAYYNTPLSQNFIGLNTDSSQIDKITFLNSLMQGNIIPLKVKLLNGVPVYKLIKLSSDNKNISSTIGHIATDEIRHYKMEGTPLPAFSFTDINNTKYDAANTKGKIIVLKCWYTACTACIKEFPECNKLVDKYSDRNDIVFISLAFNKKQELVEFLKKRTFKYSVVPEARDYITDRLEVNAYPTHILIDKTGRIRKVVNSLEELKPFLIQLTQHNS